MNIFITGANGFIGRALTAALLQRGHAVVAGVRRLPAEEMAQRASLLRYVSIDFVKDTTPDVWLPRLTGVDAVINTVGILRQRGAQTFTRLHVETPQALFVACAQLGVRRVVQLSALGADEHARSAYHLSKCAADDALLAMIPSARIAQPSLVYGRGGESARLFSTLASLPVIVVPGSGEQLVQPIHIEDLVDALCVLATEHDQSGGRFALVGAAPISVRKLLETLRAALRLPHAHVLTVPQWLMVGAAIAGEWMPRALLDRETLQMLERGNTADATETMRLLQRSPRSVAQFIAPDEADAVRTSARLGWLLPLLRGSVALLWIVTGIVSLGLYPVEASYGLLARTGAPPWLAPWLLYGAAILDLVLGLMVFVLHGPPRRWLWRTQAALIAGYSIIIALRLPEFWLHPYGPLVKNIPLLAVLVLLDVLEERE